MQELEWDVIAREPVGHLTAKIYNRGRWARDLARPGSAFMQWLLEAGNVSFSVDEGGGGGSSEPSIPIPATKLAHDEIERLARELNAWSTIEEAARDQFGASLLADLGREVSTAMHRWPMEELPHRIVDVRCGGCGALTLMYWPPRFPGDDLRAECRGMCGFKLENEDIDLCFKMLREEAEANKKLADREARKAARKAAREAEAESEDE